MKNYTQRLREYVREELKKYDSGITDEWNNNRKNRAEVLGYKLAGVSDIKEDFGSGGSSHFNAELKKWSKKYGYKFDYKFKKVRNKTKPYFVINVDVKTFNKDSKAVLALNKLTRSFGVDYYVTGKTLTVEKKERDYKDEYKKFQSSTKAKKYRGELNKYNRKKGTYGNGDGKDASHKGGKIVGFEAQSKNRGRKEKSRLKKEQKLREMIREEIQSLTESTEFIVFYNRKQYKVKAKDLYTAKKEFISNNKIPMSKWGTLAIMSKKAYDDQQFRYESVNEANAPDVKKKLLKQFGKDPLYKDVIMAKNTKEMKKAMDTLKSIRGGNAIVLMQKYANKLMGVDDKTANKVPRYDSMYRKIQGESVNEGNEIIIRK